MNFEDWFNQLVCNHLLPGERQPLLFCELRFAPPRKWKADYALGKVLIEIEGGVWSGGRHIHPAGYLKDVEKYNRAAELGYTVIRYTPQMINDDPDAVVQQVLNTWRAHQ